MRKTLHFCAAALLAVVVTGSASAQSADNICRSGGGDDVSVALQFAPQHPKIVLSVDRSFFMHDPGEAQRLDLRSLLMYLNGEDFTPWPRDLKRRLDNGPLLRLTLTYRQPLRQVADLLTKKNRGYLQPETIVVHYEDGPFGLSVPTAPMRKPPLSGEVGAYDIYLARTPVGRITDLIYCRNLGSVETKFCKHIIEDRAVAIDMDYPEDLLPQWAEISENARALYDCMAAPGG